MIGEAREQGLDGVERVTELSFAPVPAQLDKIAKEVARAGARPTDGTPKVFRARLGDDELRRGGGIGLGGILVILGIVLAIVWSFWWGLIIGLVGLIFFGGFARGRWY